MTRPEQILLELKQMQRDMAALVVRQGEAAATSRDPEEIARFHRMASVYGETKRMIEAREI